MYRCREYDYFVSECPNIGTYDSDDYESDSAALQVMTTSAEPYDGSDVARFMGERDYLNL